MLKTTHTHTHTHTRVCVCVCVCVRLHIYECCVYILLTKWPLIWLTWRVLCCYRSRGSSVSIVSGYGLEDLGIEVRSPAEARDFFSNLCVQTSSGDHPASYPMGAGKSFPGGKAWAGRDSDHSPPSRVEVVNECELYFLSPLRLHRCVVGLFYLF
jgi:hypothetical protein